MFFPEHIAEVRGDRRENDQLSLDPFSGQILSHPEIAYSQFVRVSDGGHAVKDVLCYDLKQHFLIVLVTFKNCLLHLSLKQSIKEFYLLWTVFSEVGYFLDQRSNGLLQLGKLKDIRVTSLRLEIGVFSGVLRIGQGDPHRVRRESFVGVTQ